MRYLSMFQVVAAAGLASYACFASESFCNFAESWNDHFEALRRGFENIGGKAKSRNIPVFSRQPRPANNGEFARLFETHEPGTGREAEELQ